MNPITLNHHSDSSVYQKSNPDAYQIVTGLPLCYNSIQYHHCTWTTACPHLLGLENPSSSQIIALLRITGHGSIKLDGKRATLNGSPFVLLGGANHRSWMIPSLSKTQVFLKRSSHQFLIQFSSTNVIRWCLTSYGDMHYQLRVSRESSSLVKQALVHSNPPLTTEDILNHCQR